MTYELVFRTEAEKDLEDIQDYYNKISPAITDNFFIEFFEQWILLKMNLNYFR